MYNFTVPHNRYGKTVSSSVYYMTKNPEGEWVQEQAPFIRVKAKSNHYDRLIEIMERFRKSLNEGKIKESDINKKTIVMWNLLDILVDHDC